ncbi:MAG: hypothetical protein APR62_05350 [Smithella sp. SDB]|nr:MAG: hypothetical protein APR62_05350 [Smithella sp. SDB]
MDKLYIVMPAYNEEKAIANVVDEWHKVIEKVGRDSKLVIFNDGSKDNTLRVLENIRSRYPSLVVVNKENAGHGPTCTLAYKYAIADNADWIFQTDSDGQTKPCDFWQFWEKRNNYDFIIGSRSKRADGVARRFVSQTLKVVILIIFKVIVKDANTPFRLMKVERLRKYIPAIPEDFFLPNTLLSVMITKNKEKIFWQDITFVQRSSGISSISPAKIGRLGLTLIKQLYKLRNVKA